MSLISEQIVSLGAPGLAGTLTFQAYVQAAYDQLAVAVDPTRIAAVPVADFAGGATWNYQLTGLPEPPPGGRATVVVLSATGEYLTAYSYSLPPVVPSVVFQTTATVMANGARTSADTIGLVRVRVVGLGDPSTASATFSLRDVGGTYYLQGRAAEIGVATPAGDGSYSFDLSYYLEVGHPIGVSPPGNAVAWLIGEFRLNYGGGREIGIPGDYSLKIPVRKALVQTPG